MTRCAFRDGELNARFGDDPTRFGKAAVQPGPYAVVFLWILKNLDNGRIAGADRLVQRTERRLARFDPVLARSQVLGWVSGNGRQKLQQVGRF